MPIRPPAVAGMFYPADPLRCRAEAELYLAGAAENRAKTGTACVYGGIAPHAGWAYSGAVAACSLGAARPDIDTVVVFGAVHRSRTRLAALYSSGTWLTPLGALEVDEELGRAVMAASPLIVEDLSAHSGEHSIEVEIPFLQATVSGAKLLPILVPPIETALEIGRVVAEVAQKLGRRVMFFGSSDLTHYGPRFGFTPEGVGAAGIRWATDVNDRRFLDQVSRMAAEGIVSEAIAHGNACGPGAVAATMAACRAMGATQGLILRHTNSSEVLGRPGEDMTDAVGYAAVAFI